ncbi:MAG: fumarylacetoacetate hydrolase family protein [Spirochaetia bacterium]|jgi:2-keto-4-pentenoate hydratase/2-oxohepta-3-ene-1,7-dioic acid hydratase in catechol pathway|nr:fumarylacetoacetate hydrolase family protein [Spirochaetia bacterium]
MIKLPIAGSSEIYTVDPSKIIALGLNYHTHIAESKSVNVQGFTGEVPSEPILFPKTPNVLAANGEAIVIPAFIKEYSFKNQRVDYEAELALIISRQCKNIKAEVAYDYILGYTCFNDVSQRNFQKDDKAGWFRGKSLDTFGPIGPCLVLSDDLPDPMNLDIKCRLNGMIVQDSNTKYMIFGIPEIIAFTSKNFTLEPGDIILTGTPAGVGPIKHGDVVEVEIEKIGKLTNPVTEE